MRILLREEAVHIMNMRKDRCATRSTKRMSNNNPVHIDTSRATAIPIPFTLEHPASYKIREVSIRVLKLNRGF